MSRRNTFAVLTLRVVVSVVSIAWLQAVAYADVIPPPVPANLEVPAGFKAFLIGHATGTQNYSCVPAGAGVVWRLFGPQATLFDDKNDQIITHFLSPNPDENGTPRPTWQHSRDTSIVWGAAVAASSDASYVAPGAIPWLLVQVVGTEYGPTWGDKLAGTSFVHRVNTVGGVAPATGCATAADLGRVALVPYATDYIFYR